MRNQLCGERTIFRRRSAVSVHRSQPSQPDSYRMARILLIEDERHVASFIRQGLEEEGFLVTWISSGLEGERRALAEPFDLLILDVRLPDTDGLRVCQALRRHTPTLPILMLTALDAVADRVAGLQAGADDYLPKPFAFDELIARINALLRRAHLEPTDQARNDGLLQLSLAARSAIYDGQHLDLSATEFDLLAYFIARKGQVLSRDDIHRSVWGNDFNRGTNLIDVYVGYLRKKLLRVGCPSRIVAVRGIGYRYEPVVGGSHA